MPTLVRRVSFSNRVFYSDDASESTVSTDDGLSTSSSYEESLEDIVKPKATDATLGACEGEECSKKEPKQVATDEDTPPIETTKERSTLADNEEEDERSISRPSWRSLVKEEPALVFRDNGVVHRPDEYLGGFSEDIPAQKIKLRRSWFQKDDNFEEYNQYEEWKKARISNKDEDYEGGEDESKQKASSKEKVNDTEAAQMNKREEDTVVTPENKIETNAQFEGKEISNSSFSVTKPEKHFQPMAVVNPQSQLTCTRNKEVANHEKKILEVKDIITKLQRKLETEEVRTISNLADLEEQTAKRMREYREKANNIARKNRAKEEKNNLKQQAMKSQDLIDQLRRSNQKLRAEGIKTQNAISKLRKSNNALEEKNLFHRDYASQCQNFQKLEVKLAKEMNLALKKDMPKYESLVLGMEEAVSDREKCGILESRSKELYEDCILSLVAIMDEHCHDDGLVENVLSLAELPDNEPSNVKTSANIVSEKKGSSPPAKVARRSSSNSRPRKAVSKDHLRPSKSIRRNSSGGFQPGTRRGSESGFSSSRKRASISSREHPSPTSVISGNKIDSSDDDSSTTCSVTSVQSDNVTLGGYSIDNY